MFHISRGRSSRTHPEFGEEIPGASLKPEPSVVLQGTQCASVDNDRPSAVRLFKARCSLPLAPRFEVR